MTSVELLSAFTHHVTTTAVMLPVTLDLSRERDIPASKLLMPLSFAASLGTTISVALTGFHATKKMAALKYASPKEVKRIALAISGLSSLNPG